MAVEKIIFLDFDGVVVTPRTKFLHLDPIPMKHLKSVIDATDAFIVISSVWRMMHSFPQLKAMFEPFGLLQKVLDVTPKQDGDFVRGKEIDEWLGNFPTEIKSFVILDDDSDMEPHMDRLVQTATLEGLTEEQAKKCVEMLNSA